MPGGAHPDPVGTRSDCSSYGTRSPAAQTPNFVNQVLCICAEHIFTEGSASADGFGPAFVIALDAYVGSPTEAEVIEEICEMGLEADREAGAEKLPTIVKAHPLLFLYTKAPFATPVFIVGFLPSGSTPSPSLIASTAVEPVTTRLVQYRTNFPPKSHKMVLRGSYIANQSINVEQAHAGRTS
ncbi:hypothetical protein C8R45DRAFT_940904 [Mycena sanguinolenta]|nr:hypothetical protein C8R45DRAFT_940904 [Mycena sanguinolenta]